MEKLLKATTSRCTVCSKSLPASVWKTSGSPAPIVMRRMCPEHGLIETRLSSDSQFYWISRGKEKNRHAMPVDSRGHIGSLGQNDHKAESTDHSLSIDQLSTCLALIEIVDSCNLACPTCFAASPRGTGDKLSYKPLEQLKEQIDTVTEKKGHIEILQLSGGEPTLHPDFFALIDWLHDHPHIDYVLINSNGVRLASDEAFASEFGSRAHRPNLQFYLQFDGLSESPQKLLRGADLRDLKRRAMQRCESLAIPVTLAMTVIPENLSDVWDVVTFGLHYQCCRGVSYQPMFESGRNQSTSHPLNPADIIHSLLDRSDGVVKARDFTPLPCGDPNCAIIGYLLKVDGELRSVSDFVDFGTMQGFLRDKVHYKLADLHQCGCENEPLGELLHSFEMTEKDTFRLFIKPFMDASTWDEDRLDRCCTHVIRPDGKLDSSCRYYSGFADHQQWKIPGL